MHAWAEKQQENNESETRKAYPALSGKKELRKGVHADNSLIQRQLFIRTPGNPAVVKSDREMTTAVKAPKDQKALKVKTPQYVNQDPGYIEIKDSVVDEYFQGYLGWLKINNIQSFSDDDLKTTRAKIQSMIHKTITSAPPEHVYSGALETGQSGARLSGGEAFDVAYYFDSLEEFYKYLYVSASFKKNNQNPIPNNNVKINMVNTGSGNAIVMTLPRGYLIVDLGTDLNILLNYLALRANKRKTPDAEQANEENFPDAVPRGIPLVGEESCIVITHEHTDHMGCKAGYTADTIKSIIGDSIVGYTNYAARPSDNDALARLHEFLASGNFQVYDFPPLNPRARYKLGGNSDSIIIARRNEREAIILSGDQEQKFLAPVIDDMTNDATQNPLPPVSHTFIQVPHHGSSENNTLRVINSLSRLSLATAFAISSGNDYEHPTAGAFVNQFNLYSQGTQIQYSSSLSSQKQSTAKKHTVPDKPSAGSTRTSRLFYTANLGTNLEETVFGSVVHKSNGIASATYSKRYTRANRPVPTGLQGTEPVPQNAAEEEQEEQKQAALTMICSSLENQAAKVTMDTLNAENLPLFIQQSKAQLPTLIGPDGNPNFLELFYNNLEQFAANNWNSIPALFSDIFFEIHQALQNFLLHCLYTIRNIELSIHFLENLDVSTMYEAEPDILNQFNVFIMEIFNANISFDRFSNNFYYNAVSLLTEDNLSALLNGFAQFYNDIDDPNKKSQINALIHDILNVMSISEDKSNLCIPFILGHWGNIEFHDAADMLSSSSRSPEHFFELVNQLSNEKDVQLEYIVSCILKKVISPEILDADHINTMVGALIFRSDYDTLARLAKLYPEIEKSIRRNFPEVLMSAVEQGLPIALQITNILSHANNLTVPLILDQLGIDFNTLITNTPLQYLQMPSYFNICFDYANETIDDLSAMISVYYQYKQMEWIEMLLPKTYNLIQNTDACMDFFHSLLSDSNMPLEVMNHCYQIIINQNNFTELLDNRNLLESMITYFPELLARWMLKQNDDTRYRWTSDNNDLMVMFYEKMAENDSVLAATLFYQHLLCLSCDNAKKIYVTIHNINENCIIRLLKSMDRSMAVDILRRIEMPNPLQMLAALGFDVQDLVVQE